MQLLAASHAWPREQSTPSESRGCRTRRPLTIWSYILMSSSLLVSTNASGGSHRYPWKVSSWRRILNWCQFEPTRPTHVLVALLGDVVVRHRLVGGRLDVAGERGSAGLVSAVCAGCLGESPPVTAAATAARCGVGWSLAVDSRRRAGRGRRGVLRASRWRMNGMRWMGRISSRGIEEVDGCTRSVGG
jgi:hypothetical protein